MKKYIILIFALTILLVVKAQTPTGEQLMGLYEVPTSDLPSIASPIIGSILYNPTDEKVYVYTASGWQAMGGGSKSDLLLDSTTGILNLSDPLTPGNQVDLNTYVRLAPVKELTASYTVTAADTGKVLYMNSATDTTLTLPSGLPVGFNVSIYQRGTGSVTIVGSGATVYNRLGRNITAGQYAGVGIVSYIANEFNLTGDLTK